MSAAKGTRPRRRHWRLPPRRCRRCWQRRSRPIDFYCFVAYVPLPPLSQHNGVPVLRCRIEKRLVQRTDGCGPRDEPPPHTELRRADVKVELAAACSVPSTASTGSPAICGQKRRRFWDPAPWDQGVRARRCP